MATFTQLNDDYKAKFAFPFILAVKGGAACASRRSQSAHAAACRCSHNPFNFQTNIWFLYRSSVLDEHVLSLRAKCIDMQQKYEAEVAKAEDAQSTYERERAQEEVKVTMMKDEAQWMQLQLSAGLASSKISALLSDLQKAETAIQLKLAQIKDTKAAVARRLKDADGDRNDLLKFDEVSSSADARRAVRFIVFRCVLQATREEVPLKKKLDFIQGRQSHAKLLQQRVGELLHLITGELSALPAKRLGLSFDGILLRTRHHREPAVREAVPRRPQPGAAAACTHTSPAPHALASTVVPIVLRSFADALDRRSCRSWAANATKSSPPQRPSLRALRS